MKKIILCLFIVFFAPVSKASDIEKINFFSTPRLVSKKSFYDWQNNKVNIDNFKKSFVILNIWSRSCAPCISELPSLDKLQKKIKSKNIKVITLSPDARSIKSLNKIFFRWRLSSIYPYLDKDGKFAAAVGQINFPTTLFINREGYEIGRLLGVIDWDNEENVKFFINLAEKNRKK
jgi:thiol-disulfide isomerase/thioredoxin